MGVETEAILAATQRLLDRSDAYKTMAAVKNPYGDGEASVRIAEILSQWLGGRDR